MRLKDKVAVVTGGGSGFGAGIVKKFVAEGAQVIVADMNLAAALDVAAAAGPAARALRVDVSNAADVRLMMEAAELHFGHLDILVNCVGIQREERIDDVSEAAFDEVLSTNLRGAMFLAQAAARLQVAAVAAGRQPGQQVHVLSVRAQLGMRDRGYSAYCATKGALVMLIKQHAVELCQHGITVNGVAPTVVRGEMGAHWLADPAVRDKLLQRIPLGRVAEPEDVAGPVQFFCSRAAAFVSGQILYVDGGLTATQ